MALWLFFCALWLLRMVEPFGMDQGLFACFARFSDLVPYRDIWDSKPPAVFYTWRFAAWIPLLHGDVAPPWTWFFEGVWLLATATTAKELTDRLAGRGAGIAAAVLIVAGMWAPGWGGYWARAQAEEFLALPALGAFWFALRTHEEEGAAMWCGVLTGIALLYKIPALAMAGAWCVLWWVQAGFGRTLRRVAWMLLGIALPCSVVATWLWVQGALGAMLDAVFSYGAIYSAVIGQGLSWGTVVAQFAHDLVVAVPGLLVLGVVGAVWLVLRKAPVGAALLAWIVLAAGAVISQRQLAGYHFLLLVPPLAVSGGIAVGAALGGLRALRALNPPLQDPAAQNPAVRNPTVQSPTVQSPPGQENTPRIALPRFVAVGVLVVLVAGFVFAAVQWSRAYGIDLAYTRGTVSKTEYLHALRSGPFDPAAEDEMVRLARHVPEGKPVLVWGLSPGVYALADRRPATRYPFHHLFLTDAPLSLRYPDLGARRAAFIEGLKHDPPGAIFVADGDVNGFEPKDSRTQMLEFPEFRNFVFDGYREDGRVGHWTVFVRK